jgi:hypothetical protein
MLALDIFIFGLISLDLFAGVRFGSLGFMNGRFLGAANFDTLSSACMTLFRASTGENFNGIMRELMNASPPYCAASGAAENCIEPWIPATFFIIFYTLTSFILTAMIAAVVIESFLTVTAAEIDARTGLYRLLPHAAEAFCAAWAELDPDATNLIDRKSLSKLVTRLPFPLGIKHAPTVSLNIASDEEKLEAFARFHVVQHLALCSLEHPRTKAPVYNCHQVLLALLLHTWGAQDAAKRVREEHDSSFVSVSEIHVDGAILSTGSSLKSLYLHALMRRRMKDWILKFKRRKEHAKALADLPHPSPMPKWSGGASHRAGSSQLWSFSVSAKAALVSTPKPPVVVDAAGLGSFF